MSKLSLQAETTPVTKANTTTTSSIGQSKKQAEGNNYSRLRQLLSEEPVVSFNQGAQRVTTKATTRPAPYARPSTNSSGARATNTLETYFDTSNRKSSYAPSGNYGDNNPSRGEKLSPITLAQYMSENGLYDAEAFMHHATQTGPNRGRDLYLKMASRDWEKKLSQAVDIAQSLTPDVSFRTRVESYNVPAGFDLWRGTCTFNEYMELFNHHGIGMDKIRT